MSHPEEPTVVIVSDAGIDDMEDAKRFQSMKNDFEYYAHKSTNIFGPCGFLHMMFDAAINRAYKEVYGCIGRSEKPIIYVSAAQRIKRCVDLSKEIADELSAAMGDMQRGDLGHNMMPVTKILQMIRSANS